MRPTRAIADTPGMELLDRMAGLIGAGAATVRHTFETAAAVLREEGTPLDGAKPPSRARSAVHVSADAAVTISDVFRGLQIIQTSVEQLTLDQYRGRDQLPALSSIAAKPQTDLEPSAFFGESAVDLATTGNAYWRKIRSFAGELVEVRKLTPREVTVAVDPRTDAREYSWRGQKIDPRDMLHIKLLSRTGYPLGLGPIQAAQIELSGTIAARDYSSKWINETDVPTGVLTTEQPLTPDDAKNYKRLWIGDGEEVPTGHQVRVLGQGLKYQPMLLKPSEMQFLETRQFNKTQLAALFGIPATLLLTRVDGTTQTYANVEQEWIAYVRFTLMSYLRPMEVAMSSLLPRGNEVRFNIEGLLRTDTLARYQAYEIGLRAGFLDVDEVRADEGRPARTDQDTAARASAPTTPQLEELIAHVDD